MAGSPSASQLPAAAARGLPPVVLVHGDEPLPMQEAADAVRAAARAQGCTERTVYVVDRSFRPAQVLADAGALSLFGDGRLIELRFPGRPAAEPGALLAELAARDDPGLRVLATCERLDRRTLDGEWAQRVARGGWIVAVEPVPRERLPAWIAQRLGAHGLQADPATLALIAERTEGNLLAARQEVEKLALLFPKGPLPADEARAAVLDVARFDLDALTEAVLARDASRVLRALDGLRAAGEAEQLVVWSLGETLRRLWNLAAAIAAREPLEPALRAVVPWRLRDAHEQAARALLRDGARARLQAAMQAIARADRMAKGVESGDPWVALERCAALLAGALPAGTGRAAA